MKRFLIPAIAALMTVAASSVFAASVTDKIKSMDAATYTVTLENDEMYLFPSDYDLSALKAGEEVEITFEATDGKNQATAVKSSM